MPPVRAAIGDTKLQLGVKDRLTRLATPCHLLGCIPLDVLSVVLTVLFCLHLQSHTSDLVLVLAGPREHGVYGRKPYR